MAWTVTNKLQENGEPGATSYTTSGSVTPAVNKLYTITVVCESGTAFSGDPATATHSGGLTLVKVASNLGASSRRMVIVYRAMKTSGLSAGTFSFGFGTDNVRTIAVIVDEWDGVDTSGTDGSGAIVQSNSANAGTGTTSTVTLSAFGSSNNAAFCAVGHIATEGFTVEAGYTKLGETTTGARICGGTEWKVGEDTSVTATWATSAAWTAVAAEIKAVAAGDIPHRRSQPLIMRRPRRRS